MHNKKAFTLAEVLVTLMIIGTIAAVTIPSLKKDTDAQQYVSLCQKAYSSFSQVVAKLKSEKGPLRFWKYSDGKTKVFNDTHYFEAKTLFESKMNSVHFNIPEDYAPKLLNNKEIGANYFNNRSMDKHTFMTADGMYWALTYGSTNCANDWCSKIMVDVNGQKAPNRAGVDIFFFVITPEGVLPNTTDDCNAITDNGYGCAAKVLKEGKEATKFIFE